MQGKHDAAELKAVAAGRWVGILDRAGIPARLLDGRGHPCPKCGGRDRFAAWNDVASRGVVHCRRCFAAGMSPPPTDGLATLQWILEEPFSDVCCWLASYLGIGDGNCTPAATVRVSRNMDVKPKAVPEHVVRSAIEFHRTMKPHWFDRTGELLGVTPGSLRRLRVGWSVAYKAHSFPMFDGDNRLVGVRLRTTNGLKRAVTGSRAGLFVPDGLRHPLHRLFIAEGPTDTAALLSVGLDAIGRPSCNGARSHCLDYVRRASPTESVIVADNDAPGLEGAKALANDLVTVCRAVKTITAPEGVKDARQWVAEGATKKTIEAVVEAAEARTLSLRTEVRA